MSTTQVANVYVVEYMIPMWMNTFSSGWTVIHSRNERFSLVRNIWTLLHYMMTSSNGNIFRVTGPLCEHCTPQGHRVHEQCLTTKVVIDQRSSGQDRDLVGLVLPFRSRVIKTSSALVRYWNFFGGPSVGYRCPIWTDTSHFIWLWLLTNCVHIRPKFMY